MLHYDGSKSDRGGLAWFAHPDCRVSYTYVVGDLGEITQIAPLDRRAWHAGRCRPSRGVVSYQDANSAWIGVAALTNEKTDVTAAQTLSIAWLCRWLFAHYGWPIIDVERRITGHGFEAWPRGRKSDPEGTDPLNPILSTADVRELVAHMGAPDGADVFG